MLSRGVQVTDRYTKALEQLDSYGLDVRIGALERVARDSAQTSRRQWKTRYG